MAPDKDSNGNPFPLSGVSVNKFIGDFIKENVDNYLHMHTDIADIIKQKIEESEKERKAIAGVTKLARERAKKANLHNRKLRDCRIHLNDPAPKAKKKQDEEQELLHLFLVQVILFRHIGNQNIRQYTPVFLLGGLRNPCC